MTKDECFKIRERHSQEKQRLETRVKEREEEMQEEIDGLTRERNAFDRKYRADMDGLRTALDNIKSKAKHFELLAHRFHWQWRAVMKQLDRVNGLRELDKQHLNELETAA